MPALRILSGGAANGLVATLQPAFEAAMGARIHGTFGAVGAMQAKLLAGEPADLLILTPPLLAAMTASGHVVPGSIRAIGVVRTAIAIRHGDVVPSVVDGAALASAFRAADAIYLPDTKLSTAGIHVAGVLERLEVIGDLAARLRQYPNGQTAMAAMAAGRDARPIGCTQVTEILSTPGVQLVGPLPHPHGLETVYCAAIAAGASQPDLARRFAIGLTARVAAEARSRCGFEIA